MKNVDLGKLRLDRNHAYSLQARVRRRFASWPIAVGVLAALAAGAWWVWQTPPLVQTTQVVVSYPAQQYVMMNATGYVVAKRKAAVTAKTAGKLEWLGANEGTEVKEGTLIARLESRDAVAAVSNAKANTAVATAGIASAEAELADAGMNLARMKNLYAKHYVSQIMYDDAVSREMRARSAVASSRASWEAARANQQVAENGVANTEIRAPFDGVVISRPLNVGDMVLPAATATDAKNAVAVVADLSTLEVDADVSESAVAGIHAGQPCEISLDAFADKRFRGEVSAIVPAVNRASATVTTKVRFLAPAAGILPDMSARVAFLTRSVSDADEKPVLAANPSAVTSRNAKSVVFLREGLKVREVPVTAGPMLGDLRQITAKLAAGDTLVLNPPARLTDGASIRFAEEHQ